MKDFRLKDVFQIKTKYPLTTLDVHTYFYFISTQIIYTGIKSKNIYVLNFADRLKQKKIFVNKQLITRLMLFQDGFKIAVGCKSGKILIYRNLLQNKLISPQKYIQLVKHYNKITKFSYFYQDSKQYMLSCSVDKSVKLWDLKKFQCLKTFYNHKDTTTDASKIDETNKIGTISLDKTLKIWDIQKGKVQTQWIDDVQLKRIITWQQSIAIGGKDGSIKIFDKRIDKPYMVFTEHNDQITGIIKINCNTLFGSSLDCKLTNMSLTKGILIQQRLEFIPIRELCTLKDEKQICTATHDLIKIWKLL